MKKRSAVIIVGLLLGTIIALAAPQGAAALTAPCTPISNKAHVDWEVGGVAQGTNGGGTDSSVNTFYVGVKVDVLVQKKDQAYVTVYPNSVNTALTFTVSNQGNATQKYALTTTVYSAAAATAPFDGVASTYSVGTVTTNGTPGLTSTIASIDPGQSQSVTVLVNTPSTATNGQIGVIRLTAQTQWFNSSTNVAADSDSSGVAGDVIGNGTTNSACVTLATGTVDVVVASRTSSADTDGGSAGASSARDAAKVSAANITITKSSAVYWDPVHLTVGAKAIPGAVVTYTVTITNANGAAQADNVNIIDDLSSQIPANLTFGNGNGVAGNTSFNDGVTDCTGVADQGIVVGGFCKTNAYAGLDGASWNDVADLKGGANKLAVTGLSVPQNTSVTIKYQATIK